MPASRRFGLNPQLPHSTLNDVLLGPLGASRWRIRKGWDLSAAMAVTLAWGVFFYHDHNDDNNHYRQATRFFHVTKNHGHTAIPKKYRRYLVHTLHSSCPLLCSSAVEPQFPGDTSNSRSIMVLATWQYLFTESEHSNLFAPKIIFWMLLDDLIHNMKGRPRIGRWACISPVTARGSFCEQSQTSCPKQMRLLNARRRSLCFSLLGFIESFIARIGSFSIFPNITQVPWDVTEVSWSASSFALLADEGDNLGVKSVASRPS